MKKHRQVARDRGLVVYASVASAALGAAYGCVHRGPNGFSAKAPGGGVATSTAPAESAPAAAPAPAASVDHPPDKIPFQAHALGSGNAYTDRFFELWNDI